MGRCRAEKMIFIRGTNERDETLSSLSPLEALFSFMLYAPSQQKDHKKSEITKKKLGSEKV